MLEKIRTSYMLIFLILIIGCSNKEEVIQKLDKEFHNSIQRVTQQSEVQSPVYIIIPRAGCGGCISNAEQFMIEFLENNRHKDVTFILTDFDSEKILKVRFGSLFKNKQVVIDRESVFASNQSLKSIYPTVYFFNKDNKLTKVSSISPEVNGLQEVENFLAMKTKI